MARLAILLALGIATGSQAAAPYCLAGDSCFPSESVLAAFNETVNGRLIKSQPYAAPCYEETWNETECQAIAKVKGLHAWRLPQPRESKNMPLTLVFTDLHRSGGHVYQF